MNLLQIAARVASKLARVEPILPPKSDESTDLRVKPLEPLKGDNNPDTDRYLDDEAGEWEEGIDTIAPPAK